MYQFVVPFLICKYAIFKQFIYFLLNLLAFLFRAEQKISLTMSKISQIVYILPFFWLLIAA